MTSSARGDGVVAPKRTILDLDTDSEDDTTYADTTYVDDVIVNSNDSDDEYDEGEYLSEYDDEDEEEDDDEKTTEVIEDIDADLIHQLKSDWKKPVKQPGNSWRDFWIKHEIGRKSLHSSIGFVALWLYSRGFSHRDFIKPLSWTFVGLFIIDYARLHLQRFNKLAKEYMWTLIRLLEEHSYNGTLYYVVGLWFVFSFYTKDVSVLSVLLLSWLDTAALTFGRMFGKHTPRITPTKLVAGCIASFAMGAATCYGFYLYVIPLVEPQALKLGHCSSFDIAYHPETSRMSLITFSLCTGAIASFLECVDVLGLDDNLTIPVLSAIFINFLINATLLTAVRSILRDQLGAQVGNFVESAVRSVLAQEDKFQFAVQRLLGNGFTVLCS